MEKEELLELIKTKEIIGVDLSDTVWEKIDFTGCRMERVNFKGCEFNHCRFRNTTIAWSDFRYATIQHGTFENASVDFCDFYRAFFDGVVIFNHSKFSRCSFNKTYFGDCAAVRKDNLVNKCLLQQNEQAYTQFLTEWHTYGTGIRTNDVNTLSDWDPKEALQGRWAEAEEIYKNFNAIWTGKGFIADGNWAYVQGRRMERRRMLKEYTNTKIGWSHKAFNTWKIITNLLSDIFFGYGESMFRMVLTYAMVVFLFAWAFCSNVSLLEYGQALAISLKNMAGMDSDALHEISPMVDMLNVVQTTIGIILTGIFGFILGNKIRNQ